MADANWFTMTLEQKLLLISLIVVAFGIVVIATLWVYYSKRRHKDVTIS